MAPGLVETNEHYDDVELKREDASMPSEDMWHQIFHTEMDFHLRVLEIASNLGVGVPQLLRAPWALLLSRYHANPHIELSMIRGQYLQDHGVL